MNARIKKAVVKIATSSNDMTGMTIHTDCARDTITCKICHAKAYLRLTCMLITSKAKNRVAWPARGSYTRVDRSGIEYCYFCCLLESAAMMVTILSACQHSVMAVSCMVSQQTNE